MGEVYSHLSEEERQVIQIEVGNGASIRGIGAMLGRSPSSISREIKRNTWFPSNENESYRPYRPKRLKAGPWTGRYYIAGPAQRKADRRRSKPRKPYRLSHDRLWAQVAEWLGRGWSPLLNNKNKFITQEEIGKATINRNIEGIDIAKEKVSNIAEKIRYSNQDIEQE